MTASEMRICRESFYVGGRYVGAGATRVMHGQIYVETLTPETITRPYPLVLIHGTGQTAMNWIATPDGRPGWASWYAAQGWKIYMIDQPARGRSAWQPGVDGTLKPHPVLLVEERFTAIAESGHWPQARLHTQWPGGAGAGHPCDPAFDQFYASQVASLSNTESETLMRPAGAALLDRIGPAVLMVHSQAGFFGWLIADERPDLVKGIVALEPGGPPYKDAVFESGVERPWGLTHTPLTYDPPVTPEAPLRFERQASPEAPDLAPCWLQASPARRLPHLAGIPILIASGEASYHAVYDHCTARYLTQAGVANEFVRLADHGLRGNGHMMMLEKNSIEIAVFLDDWMVAHIK